MKSLYNKLYIVATASFVLGMFFSAYNLYNLPVKLERASGKIDLTLISEISPVLKQTYFIIGVTLFMGLGGIFLALYLLSNAKASEKIVYVENGNSQNKKQQKEINDDKTLLAKEVKEIQSGAENLKDQKVKFEKILSALCKKIEASQGIVYQVQQEKNKRFIELFATFAHAIPDSETLRYEFGEGLSGQVAKEGKKINVKDVPQGYITIISGLGVASPNHLAILPIMVSGKVAYVVEIASFQEISTSDEVLIAEVFSIESDNPTKVKRESTNKKDVVGKIKASK